MSPPRQLVRTKARVLGAGEGAGEILRQRFTFVPLEPPKGEGNGRRITLEEDQYVNSVRENDAFVKLCLKHQEVFRISERSAVGFAVEACRIGWSAARRLLAGSGPLAEAEAELQRTKQRLAKCNLVATQDLEHVKLQAEKNMEVLKAQAGKRGNPQTVPAVLAVPAGDMEEDLDLVTFHEPLQFLDDVHRELVLAIVRQKMRLLLSGKGPPSLMEALMRGGQLGEAAPPRDLEGELKDLEYEMEELTERLHSAEHRAEEAIKAARLAREQLREAEASMKRLAEMEAALRDREAHLDSENARLQQEVEVARQQAWEAKERVRTSELRVQELTAEAAAAAADAEASEGGRGSRRVAAAKQALQPTLYEVMEGCPSVPSEFGGTRTSWAAGSKTSWTASRSSWRQERTDKGKEGSLRELRQEGGDRLGKRAARRAAVQTDTAGLELVEQDSENKRLRVVVQELQQKLKELVDRCRKRGLDEHEDIACALSELGDVLKHKTVFDRLYEDAVHRIARLEELRARVNRDRDDFQPRLPESLHYLLPEAFSVDPSVLSMMEQSQSLVRAVGTQAVAVGTQAQGSMKSVPVATGSIWTRLHEPHVATLIAQMAAVNHPVPSPLRNDEVAGRAMLQPRPSGPAEADAQPRPLGQRHAPAAVQLNELDALAVKAAMGAGGANMPSLTSLSPEARLPLRRQRRVEFRGEDREKAPLLMSRPLVSSKSAPLLEGHALSWDGGEATGGSEAAAAASAAASVRLGVSPLSPPPRRGLAASAVGPRLLK